MVQVIGLLLSLIFFSTEMPTARSSTGGNVLADTAYLTIPDFAYTTLDGRSDSLVSFRGKVVVLDFWFTGCVGCRIESKALHRLVKSFGSDTNVVFLSVALDGPKSLRKYLTKHPTGFQVVPSGYDLCNRLGIEGYPSHVIIDRHGKTFSFEEGGSYTIDKELRPKIVDALGRK